MTDFTVTSMDSDDDTPMASYYMGDIDDDPTFILDDFIIIDEKNEIDAVALFSFAATTNCSDIHLSPGAEPKLRINNDLIPIPGMRRLTSTDVDDIRQQTMTDSDQGQFAAKKYSHSYAYDLPGVARFRVMAVKAMNSITIVARKLVNIPPTFDNLKTLPSIRDLINFESGLILVSGVTNSGKSTLMSAMIHELNKVKRWHIISVEDPVEILHKPILSNVTQRNLNSDVPTFAESIEDAMRLNPDVLLVGEIRDVNTARVALQAAETGTLVISTTHAKSTVTSISRIINFFSVDEARSVRDLFADVLRGIISQKLVTLTDPPGRIPVNEILLNTNELRLAIENEESPSALRKILEDGTKYGMQTFEFHLFKLFKEEIISEKIAVAQAENKYQIEAMIAEFKVSSQKTMDTITDTVEEDEENLSFSSLVKKEQRENGDTVITSGAAPNFLPAPVRPKIYLPPQYSTKTK
jgi:twitching motility protein PilT